MPRCIAVLGSLNMDLVVRTPRLPEPGETVLGGPFERHFGGKGANQALAAARLGAEVAMIGCVGDDAYGRHMTDHLEEQGIDTRHITAIDGTASGVAMIEVDQRGENTIIVAPGANACITDEHLRAASGAIERADVLLMQLEVPFAMVERAIELAAGQGTIVMLNTAPAAHVARKALAKVDVLIANESEARVLCHADDGAAAEVLIRRIHAGEQTQIVITRGEAGCVAFDPGGAAGPTIHRAFEIDAVDSVAAGDAFCGGLAVMLAERAHAAERIELDDEAIRFASAAGALAATRHGAQPSLPTRAEVEDFLRGRG